MCSSLVPDPTVLLGKKVVGENLFYIRVSDYVLGPNKGRL